MNSDKVSSQVLSRICSFVFSNTCVQGGRFEKLKGMTHLAMEKNQKQKQTQTLKMVSYTALG